MLGLLSAGLGIAGSVGSALSPWLDLYSQNKANQTNKEINMMNNQFNAQEAEKVRAYNTQMWHMNNFYNSPEQQVARLREAGINPAFAMGEVAAGQVSSAPQGGSAASSSGNAHMEAIQFGQAFQNYQRMENEKLIANAQVRNIDADTDQKVIDNQTKHLLNLNTIRNLIANSRNKEEDTEYRQIQNRYASEMFSSDIRRNNAAAEASAAQARLSVADAVIRELEGVNMPQMIKLRLAEISSNIATSISIQGLNKEKAKTEVENRLESVARQHGIRLDNDVKVRTADAIVAQAWIDNITQGLSTATGISGNFMNWYKTYKKFAK